MAYIGNIPAEAYISISSQTFTTINGTVYTLSSSVESSEDIALFLNNVRQKPSTYTATSTTLTMGTATTTADELYCVYLGKALQTVNPGAGSVGTSQIADLAVTDAKLAATQDLSTKTITLPASVSGLGTGITNAQLAGSIDVTTKITGKVPTANLGTGTASSSTYLAGDQTYKTIEEYDDNVVQSNIAMLGFKVAVNGSLTRYNLVDQSIDEFYDTSGIDASASTNEVRTASGSNYYYDGGTSTAPTVTQDADSVTTDGLYTVYKWTGTGTGSYNNDTTQSHEWLVVAGGGAGGEHQGGGGGAGGVRTGTTLSLIGGNSYTPTVGAGGSAKDDSGDDSSLAGTGITTITSTGGGYGGSYPSTNAASGGSGGGGGSQGGYTAGAGNTPAITQYVAAGETTTVQGFVGGTGQSGSPYNPGGGGGAGEAGNTDGIGHGGDGIASSITGASVYYGGGGGGGYDDAGPGGEGGGGDGSPGSSSPSGGNGTANTGGGGGGAYTGGSTPGTGGSGIVILRRLTNIVTAGGDMTLQSTDVTAVSEPSYGEFVTLIENAYGTAVLNTDIKGYVSRDSGTTFTQGTLVDEGTWGTNKKVLGFHDLDISSQPSGTSMCYKITTHNQSASSKETRIYATSIGWR